MAISWHVLVYRLEPWMHNQAGISKQEWVHWMFLTGPGMDLALLYCPG